MVETTMNILFLGHGHLGKFFSDQNTNLNITGTRRSLSHDESFIQYSLGEEWIFNKKYDVIIISFPPQEDYAKKLMNLISQLGEFDKILFISSTSVYGDGEISELSLREGTTRNAKELIPCEDIIKKIPNSYIIRPSGLIDEIRHPKYFFSKNKKIVKAKNSVNLVHTFDVAAFLHYLICHNIKAGDYNLVCDDHPSKEEFYTRFHDDLSFDYTDSSLRVISNAKTKSSGFKYRFPHLSWTYSG